MSLPKEKQAHKKYHELEHTVYHALGSIERTRDYTLIVNCRRCSVPIAVYNFDFEELADYVEKGKDRPKHWGWVVHKGYAYQGA